TAHSPGRQQSLTVQRGVVVGLAQMTQRNQQNRARRQREQHAGEAEYLAESQQRKNDRDRMQSDPVADQPRNQHIAFEQLPDAVHGEDGDKARQAMPLQQCRQYTQHQAQTEAHIGHEYEQPGKDADRHGELQARDPQRDDIVDCQHDHHRELTAQKLGQHVVDFDGHRTQLRQPAPRRELFEPGEDDVPVAQQIEHHDRYQRHVDQNGENERAAGLDARQHLRRQRLRARQIVRDHRLDRVHVELQLYPELLLQPGRELVLQQRREVGQPLHQLGEFRMHERRQYQDQPQDRQDRDRQDHQRADGARHAVPLAPAYGRIADIGQDRADQERRQNFTEQVHQQHKDHRYGDDPDVLLQAQLLLLLRVAANDPARRRRTVGRQAA